MPPDLCPACGETDCHCAVNAPDSDDLHNKAHELMYGPDSEPESDSLDDADDLDDDTDPGFWGDS